MELIFSMRRKPLKCEPPHFESMSDPEVIRPICTISTCNIIAFSSPTELSDSEGDTWGGHVYVCDLDTPWHSHKVASTTHAVSALEWDNEGKLLLIATVYGDVSVYGQKDFLLNEWTCLYTANFPGEHILKAVFFHNGRRVIALDKKADAPITDRIQMLRSAPTLKGFGGVGCEGACIVTATGLVGALTPAGDSPRALTATECLRPTRDHITAASIAHKNGNLLVATVWGARVRVYVCAVGSGGARAPPAPPTLKLQPLPAVFLSRADAPDPDGGPSPPVSLTWCLREDTDSLLIAGNTLTLWKLTERAHPVHKLLSKGPLQGSTTPGGGQKPPTECFNTVVWQKTGMWAVEGREGAVGVCSARLALGAPLAVLATPRALHLLARDNHHYLCSRPVVTSGVDEPPPAATPPKKTKYGSGTLPSGASCAVVSCVELSALGGVAVCLDTHAQLHVYRLLQPATDIPSPLAVQHLSTLLEYSLVTGYDCLDVLLTLKYNIVEPLYERLTENFQRQAQSFQQYYFHSWLKLRIALCRQVPWLAGGAAWLTALQTLRGTWAACGAALRPDERPDAAPLHALAALAAHDDPAATDDKVLLSLESKPEALSELASMSALRLPLQRALDIALTTLASVPHHQSHGYELWCDGAGVSLLRRLAALARALARPPAPAPAGAPPPGAAAGAGVGAGVGGAVPDPLLRPLARLAAAASRQDLLEECLSLSAQWPAPRVWECAPRCSLSAHCALCAPSAPGARPSPTQPLYLEYGVEPDALRYFPEPPSYMQCDTTPSTSMDSIRYMHLGGGGACARWRQCARCGARALAALQGPAPPGPGGVGPANGGPLRNAAQRAYDARFLPACRCGGKWTLFSNV